MFNRLKSLVEICYISGAKRLVPCGLGDDDQIMDDDFTAWYNSFLASSAASFCFYIVSA
jgi:hypothetical protein